MKAPVREVMRRSGLYETLGGDHFFFTIDAAVRRFQEREGAKLRAALTPRMGYMDVPRRRRWRASSESRAFRCSPEGRGRMPDPSEKKGRPMRPALRSTHCTRMNTLLGSLR